MTSLSHLHENGPSRAFANGERRHKMPFQSHLCRHFGRFEASILTYKSSAINEIMLQKRVIPLRGDCETVKIYMENTVSFNPNRSRTSYRDPPGPGKLS
jgi:hypothetical protein